MSVDSYIIILFKIDLIVWKLICENGEAPEAVEFKIDLIVWKYNFYTISNDSVMGLK